MPIFTAGKIRGNIEAQKQRLDQALNEYRNTVLKSLEDFSLGAALTNLFGALAMIVRGVGRL